MRNSIDAISSSHEVTLYNDGAVDTDIKDLSIFRFLVLGTSRGKGFSKEAGRNESTTQVSHY